MNRAIFILLAIVLRPALVNAQNDPITLDRALKIALRNNAGLQASSSQVEQAKQLVGTSFNLDKTQAYYHYDENNLAENALPLNVWGISQSMEFPSVYRAQKQVGKTKVLLQEQQHLLDKRFLKKEVSKAYFEIIYWQNLASNYLYLDSLYQQLSVVASRKYELGETNYLEKLTSITKQKEITLALNQVQQNVSSSYLELNKWMQLDSMFTIGETSLYKLIPTALDTINHPGITYFEEAVNLSQHSLKVEKQKLLPDLHIAYFQGTNNGIGAQVYNGFQAGIGIPLFFGAQKSKIEASKIKTDILHYQAHNYVLQLLTRFNQLTSELRKYDEAIIFYELNGHHLSSELINTSSKAFQNGEIDFVQYILFLDNAKGIEMTYLENLNNYNKTVLELNYLMN